METMVNVLGKLGEWFELLAKSEDYPGLKSGLTEEEYGNFMQAKDYAQMANGWFTLDEINRALLGWSKSLKREHITTWLSNYKFKSTEKTVGIIMAGNIPMVGLHDLLSAFVAGYKVKAKLSKDDTYLMKAVAELLFILNPELKQKIEFVEDKKLEGFDVVIATGSNNTARYFDYYFGKYPHIIRKNRNSVAVISENDTKESLAQLGHDIFDFYGLGCRNVSKLYIPQDFKLDTFFESIFEYSDVVSHHKYANNYDYHKALFLMNRDEVLDNNFLLAKEDKALAAPVGVIYYERYTSKEELAKTLEARKDEIQCVVGEKGQGFIPFGGAQTPMLWDYADSVDTLAFLVEQV